MDIKCSSHSLSPFAFFLFSPSFSPLVWGVMECLGSTRGFRQTAAQVVCCLTCVKMETQQASKQSGENGLQWTQRNLNAAADMMADFYFKLISLFLPQS